MKTKLLSKSNSFTVKAVVIAILVLLMLIPVSMIKSIINERNSNKETVQIEINSIWGGKQQLVGPILVLPYDVTNKEGVAIGSKNAYFLPENFDVTGEIFPEKRSRGIFKILCYQSKMSIKGRFSFPDVSKLNINTEQVKWNGAFLLVGIPYLQGIKNQIVFKVNDKPLELLASVSKNELINSGLTIKMPLNPDDKKEAYNFDFGLNLNGTEGLYFTPIGKQSHINLKSVWETTKFVGEFLPNEKNNDKQGFDASWDIFDYNRNYPQMWTGENTNLKDSALGVDLLQPIDQYQKTMRSIKYAVMFIALTFLVFFIVELLSRKPIHPIQYLLVSFALMLFYCLLLALSEHMQFAFAYLISSAAIIALITAYSKSVFKNMKQTVVMGAFLTGLYIFLYIILQLEEMSLLLGSIGLFIALATVMYVSRKVEWYKEKKNETKEDEVIEPEIIEINETEK